MKDLTSAMNEDAAYAAMNALARVFQMAGLDIRDYHPELDKQHGTLTVNGDSFTYSAGTVRLMGYCPICGNEVPSRPIRRLADLSDLKRTFRPDRHDCFDL